MSEEADFNIEITPNMIEAADGTYISAEDMYDERRRAYAAIFAAMLIASDSKIKSVAFDGKMLAQREFSPLHRPQQT